MNKELEKIAKEAMEINKLKTVFVTESGVPFADENDCKNFAKAEETKYHRFGAEDEAADESEAVAALNAEIEELKSTVEAKETELNAAIESNTNAVKALADSENDLEAKDAELKALQTLLETKDAEMAEMAKELETLKTPVKAK